MFRVILTRVKKRTVIDNTSKKKLTKLCNIEIDMLLIAITLLFHFKTGTAAGCFHKGESLPFFINQD
jgi:hypothetical protein